MVQPRRYRPCVSIWVVFPAPLPRALRLTGRTLLIDSLIPLAVLRNWGLIPLHRDKGCPTRSLPAESIEMAVASNLASLASNPAMMRVLQERLPQLAHRDISEALANVEQLVEYIPDDALATLFQALYKEVSYNAAAQELNIVKYSA